MLSIKELQKCIKEPKLHQGQIYTKPKKAGQKAVNARVQGSSVAKFHNLRNLQVVNFRNPAKFPLPSFSFAFLLQISSDLIMHLRIRLGITVFESD